MSDIVQQINIKARDAEITRLRAENKKLRAALETVKDSGLLHGPTVMHDETLEIVHAALEQEKQG